MQPASRHLSCRPGRQPPVPDRAHVAAGPSASAAGCRAGFRHLAVLFSEYRPGRHGGHGASTQRLRCGHRVRERPLRSRDRPEQPQLPTACSPLNRFVERPVSRHTQVVTVLGEKPRQFIADPGGGAGHDASGRSEGDVIEEWSLISISLGPSPPNNRTPALVPEPDFGLSMVRSQENSPRRPWLPAHAGPRL